jgi:hypothetical protein
MKLNELKLALALSLAFAVVHTFFDLMSLISPETLKFVFNSWFHGFNVGIVILQDNHSYSFPRIIFGWFTSVGTAFSIGYLLAYFYNRFLGEK